MSQLVVLVEEVSSMLDVLEATDRRIVASPAGALGEEVDLPARIVRLRERVGRSGLAGLVLGRIIAQFFVFCILWSVKTKWCWC